MSDEKVWGDEEPFNDMPDETQLDSNGQPLQSPPVQLQRPKTVRESVIASTPIQPTETYPTNDYEENAADQEEEDLSDVLNDASLRLEQGTLYKLLLNSNIFDEIDADPKAVQNVQRELRKFAKERMEIMLGMKRETAVVEHLEIDFPFNKTEVEVLKALAKTATKGTSENSDRFVPKVTRTTEEISTVGNAPAKKNTLSPIRNAPSKRATPPAPQKPLQSRPLAPLKRTKLDLTIDQIAAEEGIPRELLEENVPGVGGKALKELSDTELLERNRLASKRLGTQVKSPHALPMATYEQTAQLAIERASQVSAGAPLMEQIIDAVKKMPVNNKN